MKLSRLRRETGLTANGYGLKLTKPWPALVGLSLVAGVIVVACNFAGVDFSTYSSVNYISNEFNSSGWSIEYLNGQTPKFAYLTYSAVSASAVSTTTGLPSGAADFYRLEIPNLVPNGDFENGSDPPTGWKEDVAGSMSLVKSASAGAISGTSLHYDVSSIQPWISFNLSANMADGFPETAQYRILFDMNTKLATDSALFDYDQNSTSKTSPAWVVGNISANNYSDVIAFPPSYINSEIQAASSGTGYFTIGSMDHIVQDNYANIGIITGDIDNLRVTRVDVTPYLHLAVPYASSTVSRPNLISGTYEFSLYAKLEDSSQVTPAKANTYGADGITIGLNSKFSSLPASSLSQATWTKIDVKQLVQVNSFSSPAQIVIDLFVAPTDMNDRDIGSILISSPSLTFLPGG